MRSIHAPERADEIKDLHLDQDSLQIERALGVNWSTELASSLDRNMRT